MAAPAVVVEPTFPSPIPVPGHAHPAYPEPSTVPKPAVEFPTGDAPTRPESATWQFVYEHSQTQRMREVGVGMAATDAVLPDQPAGIHPTLVGVPPVRHALSRHQYERVYRRAYRAAKAPLAEGDHSAVVWAVLRDLDGRCARLNKRLRRAERYIHYIRNPTTKPPPV